MVIRTVSHPLSGLCSAAARPVKAMRIIVPDGYQGSIGLNATLTVNPLIYKSMPFKDGKPHERMGANDLFHAGLSGDTTAQRLQTVADRYRVAIQATGMKVEQAVCHRSSTQ